MSKLETLWVILAPNGTYHSHNSPLSTGFTAGLERAMRYGYEEAMFTIKRSPVLTAIMVSQ